MATPRRPKSKNDKGVPEKPNKSISPKSPKVAAAIKISFKVLQDRMFRLLIFEIPQIPNNKMMSAPIAKRVAIAPLP
jgi:hypothetical protein